MGDVKRIRGTAIVVGLVVVQLGLLLATAWDKSDTADGWGGGPEGGPQYLIHREDWGQDKRRLALWQRDNAIPVVQYAWYGPNPARWGVVREEVSCEPAVGVCALCAVEVHRPQFALRPGCVEWLTIEPPDERLGYSI